MTSNGAEALENGVGLVPDRELSIDDSREFVERAEEAVVKPKASQELPDPFDRIEFGTVRREEQQDEARLLFEPPFPMQVGVVVFGVVDDDDDATAGTAGDTPEFAKILPAGLGIEIAFRLGGAQLSVTNADGPEVADRFSGRRVEADRVLDFRGNPHPAPAPVLLEMDLIHRPKIDVGIAGQPLEFFLLPPA